MASRSLYSKKFSLAEFNYDMHDKEMVVIVDCFKEWRHMLCGSQNGVVVYTDHRNLEYFQTTKKLNRRQARWAEILSEFNFVMTYRPVEKNGKADALSRRTDPVLEGGSDCKWGSGLLKSRLCFLTSKNHKQDYKQRGTTTWG